MENKMQTKLIFILHLIGLSLASAGGAQTISNDEPASLLLLKASLIDPLDHLRDWTMPSNGFENGSSHCDWTGIWCSSEGFVEKLDLSNMNLTGCVSEHIQSLSKLSVLNICCNAFASSLPKSLYNLSSLTSIDVSQNNFVGNFPQGLGVASFLISINASSNNFVGFLPEDLENATSLESLDLRGSFFEGSIPKSFKNLQKLKFLGLSGNSLTGKIPRELGEMSSLETIILGYNEFQGPVPAEFGNLTNLQYLDLAVGNLSGDIPAELGRLKKLTTIYLYQNNFEGSIPPEIGNMTSAVYLDFSDNRISGEIPDEIGELKNLQLLNLMCNKLTGPVPNKVGELTKLEVLELWKNFLTGSLPHSLGLNSPLQWLDVSSNSLSGEIPGNLCDSGNLTKLILFNNSFSGSIPLGLSSCPSLIRVRIQNNLIGGTIPVGLGNLPKLQRLELANNNLSGEMPDDFALSTSLSFIDVSSNHLQSSLPSSILSIPNLQTFLASNNDLEGNIPDQFQDYPSLSVLDLSSNHLSGSIPQSIASCEKLVNLNLRNNQLTGEIPPSLATMPTLAILDLSNNSITGHIPQSFGSSPALEMLNLSYNKLEGLVPNTGMLMTINPNDLIANAGLCGGILPPCSKSSNNISRPRKVHIKHIALGFVVGVSVILALGLILLTWRWMYKRWYLHSGVFEDWFRKSESEWPWRLVAFQRLNFTSADILACNKESNVIGMGSTGIVFKAEILRPHSVVAVKKFWRSEADIETGDDLLAEVNLLGRLRHRNIVRLLGYLHNETDIMMEVFKENLIFPDIQIAEYGYTLKVDEKSDIYSFGVVLLELLTGKMPLDPSFGESIDIVEWVRRKISSKASEQALDTEIAGQCQHVQEEMLLVLRIALLCTAKLPKDRPSMRDIITMLGEAKPRRKSVCHSWGHNATKEKPIFGNSPVAGHLVLVSEKRDWCCITPDQKAQALKRMRGKHGATACDTVFKIEQLDH
ncbi:hypothetical protein RJ639_024348 [Escallonia herrerae]|uniref:Protein kinase domain-containing protein n=1 Tax=Escallonia herrerae TaxID=1293975 RepID=A0AA88V116_9ASTE|nr:hypothetical protein RJ639_024348 [Escallonia herrerae]